MLLARQSTCCTLSVPRCRRLTTGPVALKFLKQLGLKKPAFLPDFGKEKRLAVLNRVFTGIDERSYNELLADDFVLEQMGEHRATYRKQDWIDLLVHRVKPAIPDYNWGHSTDGSKDEEGFSIVAVQATGHHTGEPFALAGMVPVQPDGRRFKLEEERMKIKVEDGRVQKVVVLPSKAGPRALYQALGGKLPAKV